MLTCDAFATVIPWFPIVLAVAVVALRLLDPDHVVVLHAQGLDDDVRPQPGAASWCFKLVYCVFIVIGTVLTFRAVLGFADAMLFVCALVNIFGLYLLMPEVRACCASTRPTAAAAWSVRSPTGTLA